MANVIDAFVITLGLDPRSYRKARTETSEDLKKFKDEARQRAQEVEDANKRWAESYGQVKREVLGLVATIVGAKSLEQFVAKTTSGFAQVYRQATLMGESAREVQAWALTMERAGDSADTARQTLAQLTATMQQWRRFGIGAVPREFQIAAVQIGAQMTDSPFQIFQRFAQWAQGKNPRDINLIGSSLGFDQAQIIQAMRGPAEFNRQMQVSRGMLPTDEQIKQQQELYEAFQRLKQAVGTDAQKLFVDIAPALDRFLKVLDALVEKYPEQTKAVIAFTAAAFAAATAINTLRAAAWLLGLSPRGGGGPAAGGGGGGFVPIIGRFVAAAGIEAGAQALTGAAGTPANMRQVSAALANPQRASDADLAAAIAFTQDQLARAPAGFKDIETAQLNKLRMEQSRRGGAGAGGITVTPEGQAAASTPAGAGQVTAAFLAAHGINPAIAVGVGAGVAAEGGTPTAFNASGGGQGAFGIGQWRGERLKRLRARYGQNPTLQQQLEFLLSELRGGDRGGASVLAAQSTQDAMVAYLRDFMRPGTGLASDLRRGFNQLGLSGIAPASLAGGRTSIHIDRIIVQTQATDARGVARGVRTALESELAAKASTGLTG